MAVSAVHDIIYFMRCLVTPHPPFPENTCAFVKEPSGIKDPETDEECGLVLIIKDSRGQRGVTV